MTRRPDRTADGGSGAPAALRHGDRMLDRMDLPPVEVSEPDGFVVVVEPGDRIHFLDWGGPPVDVGAPPSGVLLIHGLSQTAWAWAPVARRLRAEVHVVAMDLRGHGLSDAPTDDGAYALDVLARDAVAVAEGSGLLRSPADRVVLAGHGFGAIVAAGAAVELAERCIGLVLVDGGWESIEASSGLDVDEFLRGLDEPPEVMRTMAAFLADRAGFDAASWDADQERAARATVVETHAGRVVPATRPHALEASVRTMFGYDPLTVLPRVGAGGRIVALVSGVEGDGVGAGGRSGALASVAAARVAAGETSIETVRFPYDGHNLMRYRPAEVSAAMLRVTRPPDTA